MSAIRTIFLALAGSLALSAVALAQDNGGRLARLDTDGDNALSLDEFLASNISGNVDSDADGAITLEEYVASLQRRPRGNGQGAGPNREQMQQRIQQRLSERFEGMDADNDGVVSVNEYRTNVFGNLDRDGNGLLEGGELTAQRNRGGRGPGRRISGQQN